MIIILSIYFALGLVFLLAGSYSEKFNKGFFAKLKLLLITIAWPIVVVLSLIMCIWDKKFRNDLFSN